MKIDPNVLKKLANTYGVFPAQSVKGLAQTLQSGETEKAPAKYEPILLGNDYAWSDEKAGYVKGSEVIYWLPQADAFFWVWDGKLARGFQADQTTSLTAKLTKWIQGDEKYPEGKGNKFMTVYQQAVGGSTLPPISKPVEKPSDPNMDRGEAGDIELEPMKGPPPSRLMAAPAKSEADTLLQQLTAKAKIGKGTPLSKQAPLRLPADDIIDIYKKAKEIEKTDPAGAEKILTFIKANIRVLEEGRMMKSDLEVLVRGIVRGVVNEIAEAKKKKKKYRPDVEGEYVYDPDKNTFGPPGKDFKPDDDPQGGLNWPIAYKNDPYDPATGGIKPSKRDLEPHSQMDWEPSAEDTPKGARGPSQEEDYKNWLEDLANQMWRDPNEIGHGEHLWRFARSRKAPSGETVYLLKKQKIVDQSRFFMRRDNKWFYLNPDPKKPKWLELGKEHPSDEPSIEETSTTGAAAPVTGPNAFKSKRTMEAMVNKKEVCPKCGGKPVRKAAGQYRCQNDHGWIVKEETKIEETTTTMGGTPGYNVPGAFSRRGGSKAGVEGSKKLGYELTPIGKKDMERTGDKILESVMGSLGPKFGAAQRAYDAQTPPDEPDAMECPKCKEEAAYITKSGKRGGSWWWEARCNKCGHKWGDDNF